MPLQYVSLLNTSFSGSTLVSMLLCSQPRIVGFGDTYVAPDPAHYPQHPCTCGRWFDECPPRIAIRDAVRSGGIEDYDWDRASATPVPKWLPGKIRQIWPFVRPSSLPLFRAIPTSARNFRYRRFYLETELMLKGLEETGDYDIYIDGCKSLVRAELLRTAIPDLKVLHMIRHPGAFLYHFHRLGQLNYDKYLRRWRRYNHHARQFGKLLPGENYKAVTYESIVQDPEAFVEQMVDFMGMTEVHSEDCARIRRPQTHIIGNRMRETVDRVLDFSNTWRGKMPANVEDKANEMIARDDWLASLYEGSSVSQGG